MANPQRENGYTAISNEIMEALCHIRIPGEARQILDVIFRKTYGFNKKEDRISLSQFCLCTGLSKVSICKNQKKLIEMNMVSITQKGNDIIKTYRINKDFDTWKPLPKKVTLPKKVPTKVDNTKETITKEIEKFSSFVLKRLKMKVTHKKELHDYFKEFTYKGMIEAVLRMESYYKEIKIRKWKKFKFADRWNKMIENLNVFLSDESLNNKFSDMARWNKSGNKEDGEIYNKKDIEALKINIKIDEEKGFENLTENGKRLYKKNKEIIENYERKHGTN